MCRFFTIVLIENVEIKFEFTTLLLMFLWYRAHYYFKTNFVPLSVGIRPKKVNMCFECWSLWEVKRREL